MAIAIFGAHVPTFQAGSDGEPHYVIDENENLQDLIAKLDKQAITPSEEQ
jgi:hypothetical protein